MNQITTTETPSASVAMTPMQMVSMALERNVPAEILKQMMDLRDREEARNAKIAFTQAVAKAKEEIRPIVKTREVDYTPQGKARVNYRHEDLAGIEEQVAPILSKNGLSYTFESDNGIDRPITVTCVLEHIDGHATRTPLSAGADTSGGKNSLQAIASTITYLQRYTLKLALGLSVSHDDDAQTAVDTKEPEFITKEKVAELLDLIDETGIDIQRFCQRGKIDSLAEMPARDFADAKRALLDRKANQQASKKEAA